MKQSRYNTILDSVLKLTKNTVFEIAPDFTFIEVYLGQPGDLLIQKELFLGRRVMDVLPGAYWEMFRPFFESTFNSGEKIYFSYPSFEPGDGRWFSASLQFISSGCDYPFYLLCVTDNTTQREAEESIRFQAAFEEQMIYATSILLQSTEENFNQSLNDVLARIGSFVHVDRAYLFVFNAEQTHMTNTHEWCSEGIQPEIDNLKDLPLEIFPEWMRVISGNEDVYIPDVQALPESWAAEKAILEPQGIQSLLALPVQASGQLFGFIGYDAVKKRIQWDKSQRQLLQLLADNVGSVMLRLQQSKDLREVSEKAQQLAAVATQANRYKTEFLANMSHEMRTPLHGVLGFTDVLMQSGLTPLQEQYMGHLRDSADIMLKVINQILDFSKIESGNIDLVKVKTNLPELLQRCISKVKLAAEAKNLEIIYEHDHTLPVICMLDDLKLEQVLINLLGNAVKFTDRGSVWLKTGLADSGSGLVRFSIIDTGIGVSAVQQQHIFNAFSQADNSIRRKYGGTGLGLSICKKLLNLMGSELKMISTEGQGSEFYFDLQVHE